MTEALAEWVRGPKTQVECRSPKTLTERMLGTHQHLQSEAGNQKALTERMRETKITYRAKQGTKRHLQNECREPKSLTERSGEPKGTYRVSAGIQKSRLHPCHRWNVWRHRQHPPLCTNLSSRTCGKPDTAAVTLAWFPSLLWYRRNVHNIKYGSI